MDACIALLLLGCGIFWLLASVVVGFFWLLTEAWQPYTSTIIIALAASLPVAYLVFQKYGPKP